VPSITERFFEEHYGKTIKQVKEELIHTLHLNKIYRLEGRYEGGHDEGGLEELQAWDKQGNELDIQDGGDVWHICNDVLTTKFLSWALGASVVGTLHVDMGKRKVWTEGEIEMFVPDENPIDWSI
jgi:hypothetical protein